MSNDQARRLAQLKEAARQGILDADTYQAAVIALNLEPRDPPDAVAATAAPSSLAPLTAARNMEIGGNVSESDLITGDNVTIVRVYTEAGVTLNVDNNHEAPPVTNPTAILASYLHHLIRRNRYLQLQGIRSAAGQLVHIELDHIYIRLRTTQQRLVQTEDHWLAEEAALAPGELQRHQSVTNNPAPRFTTETITVKVEEAMTIHPRLVVLGDPGSGKTTLLRYLALLYARDLLEGTTQVQTTLVAAEPARLPIFLSLRQISSYLHSHADASSEGHKLLLDFLLQTLDNERIAAPINFFDEWLTDGRAVILLDGLDEIVDPPLRRRVARLVEHFTQAYPACRYIVTSRIVGYTDAARLGENYVTTTVRDFNLDDIRKFLTIWHRLVAIGERGAGPTAEAYAADQTNQLLQAIERNDRIRELAINPLMLTVIAMVHRDRVSLPDRRAELYAAAVDILLGKWDAAKGVLELPILPGLPFETHDKRLMLQNLALHLHEQQRKEIDLAELRRYLLTYFAPIVQDERQRHTAVERFLALVEERTGLLVARGEGVYAFGHLTFQEYLAALAIANQDDYVAYTLQHAADPWWREVILLEAGTLSMQGKARPTRLIQAIADKYEEPEPYHNLVLAAECLRDVGASRIEGNLDTIIQARLRTELQAVALKKRFGPIQITIGSQSTWLIWKIYRSFLYPLSNRLFGPQGNIGVNYKSFVERRIAAATALGRINGQPYWLMPYGEPNWLPIPAGEFWLGPATTEHRLYLDAFLISPVPITNLQYQLFIHATNHSSPKYWEDDRFSKDQASHPVVGIQWHDVLAYCSWLSQVTSKKISIPSEAQWEKAARGSHDKRHYPWGNEMTPDKCNYKDLLLQGTTPVGIFPSGASPYGCLDMAGNVWEWTRSLWGANLEQPDFNYPYDPLDGRENSEASDTVLRVVRGGGFRSSIEVVGCTHRDRPQPNHPNYGLGFRVICFPT